MNIKTDGRGRVQISAFSSVTTMGLKQAERVYDELGEAIAQAEVEDQARLAAVAEAHNRMAEALG